GAYAIPPAEHRPQDHYGKERNDYDKPKHQHIMLYERSTFTSAIRGAFNSRSGAPGYSQVVQ
ncbi:MAG: hypothetical protein WAK42_17035, partial [Mycobacterium sp.]